MPRRAAALFSELDWSMRNPETQGLRLCADSGFYLRKQTKGARYLEVAGALVAVYRQLLNAGCQ